MLEYIRVKHPVVKDEVLWAVLSTEEVPSQFYNQPSRYLTPAECGVYNRRKQVQKKRQFCASRLLLKRMVSDGLAVSPSRLSSYFDTNLNKLRVLLDDSPAPVHVSLSHSHNMVAVAMSFSPSQPLLGIDIEKNTARDFRAIAAHCFAQKEYLEVVSSEQPEEVFYRLWSTKEAFAKAKGVSVTEILGTSIGDLQLQEGFSSYYCNEAGYTLCVSYAKHLALAKVQMP